ncbi:MAG: hypothetical protein ACRETL_03780, partial [Gammaproteobacteria bacterium]
VYGTVQVTQDLDVCCRFSEENLRRIQAAVADLHPAHRMRPDLPFELAPEICASLKNLYLKTDLGILDCLGEIKGVGNYDLVYKHSVVAELPLGEFRVLDLDALIVAKQAMNREHDQIAIKKLRALQERNKLDNSNAPPSTP